MDLNRAAKQFEELSLPAEPNPENQRNHEELQQKCVHNILHIH